MKEILNSKYKFYFLAGLVIYLLCAWFSAGFNYVDEHYQVLEFCSFKMGFSPASALPWEFGDMIRASLLPDISYVFAKIMSWIGVYNPFTLAFLLRLLTGIASWFIICKMCLLLYPKFKTPIGERLFILMSLFMWFVPFLNVRYSSETISGLLFLYSLYVILNADEKGKSLFKAYMLAGFLFGFAFFVRFHVLFAAAGLLAWLVLIRKIKLKYVALFIASSLVAVGLNVVLDHWFYGQWTFTPFNYFYVNIIQHKAATFGVQPWWFYFSDFIMRSIPPLSLILMGMFLVGIYKNPKSPLVWTIVPFIILHFFTAHKELRFLFPVTFIFIYSAALGFDHCLTNRQYLKIHKYVYAIILLICIPAMTFLVFVPAQVSVNYSKFIYSYVQTKSTPLFILNNDDYSMVGYKSNFYKSPNVNYVSLDSLANIGQYLNKYQPKIALFLYKEGINFNGSFKGYKTKMLYCYYPELVEKLDINKWEERSHIWSLYQLDKED